MSEPQPTPLAEITKTSIPLDENGIAMPSTVEDQLRIANLYLKSGMMPKQFDTPAKIIVAIQLCKELGLKPMTGIRQICVINGTPSLFGDLPLSLVMASGKCEKIHEHISGDGDEMMATCVVIRNGNETIRSFSVQDAKTAGLWGRDIWKKYFKRMLQMRARSHALKDAFPDVLNGISIAEYDYGTDGSDVEIKKSRAEILNEMVGAETLPQNLSPNEECKHE